MAGNSKTSPQLRCYDTLMDDGTRGDHLERRIENISVPANVVREGAVAFYVWPENINDGRWVVALPFEDFAPSNTANRNYPDVVPFYHGQRKTCHVKALTAAATLARRVEEPHVDVEEPTPRRYGSTPWFISLLTTRQRTIRWRTRSPANPFHCLCHNYGDIAPVRAVH